MRTRLASSLALKSRASFFSRVSYNSLSISTATIAKGCGVFRHAQHPPVKRTLVTAAHNTDVTHLIKPGESSEVHAAIFTTSDIQPYSLFLKEKNSTLQYVFNLRDITRTSPAWFLQQLSRKDTTEQIWPDYLQSINILHTKSFTQKAWINFLDFLNPLIIGNLRVDNPHRRHLVDAYNFCLSDNPIITRNRSQAIGSYPFIRYIFKLKEVYNDEEQKTFVKRLDDGESPLEALKEFSSHATWATDAFIKRMACAPNHHQVKQIGELLVRGLGANDQFDTKRYGSRVSNIPSSTKDPENFQAMIDVADIIKSISVNDNVIAVIASQLFVNIGNNWAENKASIKEASFIHSARDYIKAVTEDLLVPYFFIKLNQIYNAKGKSMPVDFTHPFFVNYTSMRLGEITGEHLTASLTPITLLGYSNRWHRNQTVINAKKPLLVEKTKQTENEKDNWHAIIQDQLIEGCTYKVLTSPNQLSHEGQQMHHCVGGYVNKCKLGESHIFSGKGPNDERFTLELTRYNNKFIVNQLLGVNNRAVSANIRASADLLVDRINTGKIASNSKFGAIVKDESLQSQFGFDLFDREARESLFQIYQETRVLPKPFQKYKSLSELLEKTGLDILITKMAEDDIINSAAYQKWLRQHAELRNYRIRDHFDFDLGLVAREQLAHVAGIEENVMDRIFRIVR